MIYTLTRQYNSEELVQWYNILYEYDFLDIKNLYHEQSVDDKKIRYSNYLGKPNNVDFFKNNITENDILILDAEYLFGDEPDIRIGLTENIKEIEKYKFKKIIVFSKDRPVDEKYNTDKVIIYSPSLYTNFIGLLENQFNFYLVNAGFSDIRDTMETLSTKLRLTKKYKKFICLNGSVKGHRTFMYNFMKKENILKDTFFSYMAYDLEGNTKINPNTEFYNYNSQIINLFGKDATNYIIPNDYYGLFKDLPLILDSDFAGTDFTLYPPVLYSMNSYFEIVTSTDIANNIDGYVYTDEKTFRPFLSFNIPIFLGEPGLRTLLKNYGFDLFEDIIDYGDDYDITINRINNVCNIVKSLSEKSMGDIEFIYKSNEHRLQNNFDLLKSLAKIQVKNFIKEIIPNEKREWL